MEKLNIFENLFGSRHSAWVEKARVETGSLAMGASSFYLAKYFLPFLGISNPLFLTLAAGATALAGYKVLKSAA